MEEKSTKLNLNRYWPFWGLNFGLHMVIGLVASIAGLVVIFNLGEVLNGIALVGAGSFAIINGWFGCQELAKSKGKQLYRISN